MVTVVTNAHVSCVCLDQTIWLIGDDGRWGCVVVHSFHIDFVEHYELMMLEVQRWCMYSGLENKCNGVCVCVSVSRGIDYQLVWAPLVFELF